MRSTALFILLLATVTTNAFAAPATALRVTLPETVYYGHNFDFTVEAIDGSGAVDEPDEVAVQWYRGARGDLSNRVNGATSRVFITPPITENTTFWAEIQTSCGTIASNAATVSVSSRRRAVRHP